MSSESSAEIKHNTVTVEDAESGNERRFPHLESPDDDDADRFERIDQELKTMQNYIDQLAECDCIFCKLGLDHDGRPKIYDITESINDGGRHVVSCPPRTADPQPSHYPPEQGGGWSSELRQSCYQMDMDRASDLLLSVSVCGDLNKGKITQLAVSSMEELTKMAEEQVLQPLLWLIDLDGETEILNTVEYNRQFGSSLLDSTLNEIIEMIKVDDPLALRLSDLGNIAALPEEPMLNDLKFEASRETCVVPMSAINLVKIFMDVDKWSDMFHSIVSRAMALGVLSTGEARNLLDGALQVMAAEFCIPTPLVPVRECHFARYSKQLALGKWGVVDVSLESIFPNPLMKYRRRPSGCIIQQLPNGHSKVIWIEHVEADIRVVPDTYQALVGSGYAFSAKRWVSTLVQQIERCATSDPDHNNGREKPARRENLYRLSERMMKSFCENVNASTEKYWMPPPMAGFEDVRIMTSTLVNPHVQYPSNVVIVATSVWIPAPMRRVFNFLRDVNSRYEWDIRLRQHIVEEILQMNTGSDPGNCISILQVNASPNKISVLYLQESCFDMTGAYVVYAPIDVCSMNAVLSGGDPDCMIILPSGFAILPNMRVAHGEEIGGTNLTFGFQMMDNSSTEDYLPPKSVGTVCGIIKQTLNLIMDAVVSPNHP